MRLFRKLTLLLTLTIVFSACSNSKTQTKKYFRLTTSPAVVNTDIKPIVLVVKRPKALSILGSRPIVATQADDSLIQLSHNFWLESPKVLLQDRFKQWAENHWQTVSYQAPADENHQILESRIMAFEKKQNQAVVSVEFLLYDADNRLIFNQALSAKETITEDNYHAFAKAISLAIESILSQFNNQLNGSK